LLLGTDNNKKTPEGSESSDADANHEFGIKKGQSPATPGTSDGVKTSPLACDESTAIDHDDNPKRPRLTKVCEDLSSTFEPPSFSMPNYLMQPLTFPSLSKKPGFKCVPTLMVKQLMKVCKLYLQQSSDTTSTIIPTWNEVGTFSREIPGIPLVDRLKETIVHILASWAGLESYLYGIVSWTITMWFGEVVS
jgi:hypothetical protein